MGEEHPLRVGVTVIVTRHLGPYKLVLRCKLELGEAANCPPPSIGAATRAATAAADGEGPAGRPGLHAASQLPPTVAIH